MSYRKITREALTSRRFVPGDLDRWPGLTDLAVQYVMQYRGEFEPLIHAQYVIDAGEELTRRDVKTILNSMIYDRNWIDRLNGVLDGEPVPPAETQPVVRMATTEKPKGQPIIQVGVAIKTNYLMSAHRYASVVHFIDKSRSYGLLDRDENVLTVVPIVLCQGNSWYGPGAQLYPKVVTYTNLPTIFKVCPKCFERHATLVRIESAS